MRHRNNYFVKPAGASRRLCRAKQRASGEVAVVNFGENVISEGAKRLRSKPAATKPLPIERALKNELVTILVAYQ